MGNVLYEEASVQAIAEALRLKRNGSTETFTIGEMGDGVLNLPFGNIPSYHYAEAGRVVKRLLELKALYPNSICFGNISDNHVDKTNENTMRSARHAVFALETVGNMACDFVANLCDNISSGSGYDTEENYEDAVYMEKSSRYAMTSQVSFSALGNHDKSMSTQKLYDLIGKYNNFDVSGITQIRGYGYKDFNDKCVRVTVLNTCDYWNIIGGNGMSYEQKDFLMRALDLSDKDNPSKWLNIILSHIPVDFLGGDYNKGADLKAIFKAYDNGTTVSIPVNSSYASAQNETPSNYETYSNGALVYNYSGKNLAKVINIHGHVHTNICGKLIFIDDNTELSIQRIAIPNSSFNGNYSTDRYTEYGNYSITTEEANKIKKVAGTKADTSATFIFIDLDGQIAHCIGYGADIDRTVVYKDATTYKISYNLTNVSASNKATVVIEGEPYTTTLSVGSNYTLDSVTVKMGGVDITATAYSNGVVTVSEVTGDIVISAIASIDYPFNNLFDATDTDFVDGAVLRSSGGTKAGTGFVSGYIEAVHTDDIRVRCPSGTDYADAGVPIICLYNSSKTFLTGFYPSQEYVTIDADGLGFMCHIARSECAFIRVQGTKTGAYGDFIVTKNEEITI